MNLHQLRCFVEVAQELHFGRAAQNLGMMPSALGRHIRLLEESLDTQLLNRTTRSVTLTGDGDELLREARKLLNQVEKIRLQFRSRKRDKTQVLRIGAIDSASAGLMPMLISDFRKSHPEATIQLVEDKTVRLLPKLLSGSLDLAFVRPPGTTKRSLKFMFLFNETTVVAVPDDHALARRKKLSVKHLSGHPMIVPDRRSRPHSHDLTMNLFEEVGLEAQIAQIAEEKHTIVNLVAAGIGLAIVPRWTSRMAVSGVRYIPLAQPAEEMKKLPLAACWVRDSKDTARDALVAMLEKRLTTYAKLA